MTGVGRTSGRQQISQTFPDGSTIHPNPDLEWLKCDECSATWLGDVDMDCPWCTKAEEAMRRWQAEMVLRRPDVDPDNAEYDGVIRGWGERLTRAVDAGIVDEFRARAAWKRASR